MSVDTPGLDHTHIWLVRKSGFRDCLYCTATAPLGAHILPCKHDFLRTPNGILHCMKCQELHEE